MKQRALSLLAMPLIALMAPTISLAQESEHTVKDGETLNGIANRAGVSPGSIVKANGLKEPYALRIGQKLKIPAGAAKTNTEKKAPAASTTHVVKDGETLNGIANRAGVSSAAIVKANGLKEPYALRVGQKLAIPGGKSAPAASAPATSAAATSAVYLVKDGETLNGIANRAGVSSAAIIKANDLKPPYALRVGQKLTIPGAKPSMRDATEETQSEDIHVVEPGETLNGIANRAGIPRVLIAEANGIPEPYEVQVGQKLLIPRKKTHVVKNGETGFGIAYQYGIPFHLIAIANGLEDDAVLKPGQRLIIPVMTKAKLPDAPVVAAPKPTPVPATKIRPEGAPDFRWPVTGNIIVGFAPGTDVDSHGGIDISAKSGTTVRAAAAGSVLYAASEAQKYGNLVIIDHGNGWHSAYGHLKTIAIEEGVQLRAGAAIGSVGQSGSAKEPKLHFEIRKNNKPVDPRPLLGDQGPQ